MNQSVNAVDRNSETKSQEFAWQALNQHFGEVQVEELASSRRQFPHHTRADLQRTLVDLLAPFSPRLLGVNQNHPMIPLSMPALFVKNSGPVSAAISLVPVQSQEIDVGEDSPIGVFDNALWLVSDNDQLEAAILFEQHVEGRDKPITSIEIVYLPNASGTTFTRQTFIALERAVYESRLYRGKVISLEEGEAYSGRPNTILVHRLPAVAREDLILPNSIMQLLDRNIFGFARSRRGLKELHQSLQKGILLYGPPGTGKTHTIRYLATNLPDHTTILISADQVAELDRYMLLARLLQPSMVVIEDVDLIGRHRESMRGPKEESLLNRLLNEMDGLNQDAEILFVLTTNQPEAIEDALAARPGRVDQAIEVPLPDAECRGRLLRLYGARMNISDDVVEQAVTQTEGVSAAFVKELVRRLAQESIMRGAPGESSMNDLQRVLAEMLHQNSKLNHALLGATINRDPHNVKYVSSGCF